jgi:membrane peptidoglycan carboxypeptidase
MNGGERLQLGRDKNRKPAGGDAAEGNFAARVVQRWKLRRQAKKRRLAAMTPLRRNLRRVGVIGTWFLGLFALLMVIAVVLFYVFTDVRRPEDVALPQLATIEYSDGSVLAKVGQYNHTIVSLDRVPPSVRWAVIAAEDRGFYHEPGFSITGTMRAALSDIFGGDTQGGSGITQQYVKNAYLNDSRTLTRKIKELMIAIKLSREYSKNKILEFYLNTVYFGRGAYGVAAAAQTFFGVDVSKLTTAQGALLAAMLRSPGYYDPATNRAAAVGRWNYVLDGMESIGHLSKEQRATLKFPTVKAPNGSGLGTTGWKWLLVNAIFAELSRHGIDEKQIYANGLVIRTTIDPKAQQAALHAIKTTFADLTPQQRNMKNALVAVNPKNGAVLAYYGGSGLNAKGYDGKVDYNDYASKGLRPPGSSFKPYTLATVLTQTLKKAKGEPHLAINSYVDGSYCVTIEATRICNDPSDKPYSRSRITIKNAMKYSLNTTFDLLASRVGPDKVAATAHAMGVRKTIGGTRTLQNSDGNTTFGIGIGDYPVSPIDQAVGFATLANSGKTNDAYLVQRATTPNGDVFYQHHARSSQAIDPKVANDVTITLEPVAGFSLVPLDGGRPSAAKTGTEGMPKGSGNSDAWMVGFTPQVSAAVWVGTGYSKPIVDAYGNPEYGRDLPGRTWKAFMDTYLAGKPALPLPTKQLIKAGPGVPGETSASPSPSKSSSSTSSPPSSSSSTAPPTSASSSSSSPAPSPSTSSCGGLLGSPCPSPSSSTSASASASASASRQAVP